MNTNFVNIIKRIIAEQGEAILANPAQLKGFVADYAAAESKPERLAFGRCIEYGAYTELKNAPDAAARKLVKTAVAQKVLANTGLDIFICNGALDALEAALFGSASSPTAYQPPQYQPSPPASQYQPPQQYQAPQVQQQYQPPQVVYIQQNYQPPPTPVNSKDKGIAIVLYVFLGTMGAHYFYAGNVGRGIICFLYNIGLAVLTVYFPVVGFIAWLLIWIIGLVRLCNWQTWLYKYSK
jgi:TM2 domain-containing membrane protein YozV